MKARANLPLLVKFLFTTEKLSVQVHPDDAYAARIIIRRGKTEMWHVLAAEPGAQIAAGFREHVSAEQLRAAALSGEIENLLEWFDARPATRFLFPPERCMPSARGLMLCEIQQLLRRDLSPVRLRPSAGAAHRAVARGEPAGAAWGSRSVGQ